MVASADGKEREVKTGQPAGAVPPAGASGHRPEGTGSRIALVYGFLFALNAGSWLWAWLSFRQLPILLGNALLAYSLGLRHAVDADHIAAIDNVTRKLMQEGKRPVTVGLLFSLGHSTVVVAGAIAIAASTLALQHRLQHFRELGGLIGTLTSTTFLFAIAIINLLVLRSIYQAFQRVRRGEPYVEEDLDMLLAGRGLLARVFRPVFRLVRQSWHMYPLGLLFGLGFDTATEIGLVGLAAAEAAKGLSLWTILVFPVLFTAGMSLVDTTDNVLMLGAYGWAYVKPVRKLYYNLTITALSVLVAVVVGGVEALGLVGSSFHLRSGPWQLIARLNDHLGFLGYGIAGLFALGWAGSMLFYRWREYEKPGCGAG